MTYLEAYTKGIKLLRDAGADSPAMEAAALMRHVAGADRVHIYAHGDEIMEDRLAEAYFAILERRASGCPLQYLTGEQEFMSLKFGVRPGVLIPRQETELLVETAVDFFRKRGKLNASILDMGTGSGCIAVSIAHYLPGSVVTAVDIMPDALAVALENARKNGVEGSIRFIWSNLFENIPEEKFDAIISNPPYVRSGEICELKKETRDFEPIEALDGGADGLRFFREITGKSRSYLAPGGLLAFETGYGQASDVARLMSGNGFGNISVYKDLAGIERVVASTLSQEAPW